VGQSDRYPYLVKLNIDAKAGFADAYETVETVNPRKLLLGTFDTAFVIVYLLPLFVLALSHDLLASEFEGS
jgi:ABC-2 type transport system permease protein